VAAFDLFPLEVIDNKTRWVHAAIHGEWICGFAHEPEVAFARLKKVGQSFAAVPYAVLDDGHAETPVLL